LGMGWDNTDSFCEHLMGSDFGLNGGRTIDIYAVAIHTLEQSLAPKCGEQLEVLYAKPTIIGI
jgi:hypothetical protein